MKIDIKLVTSGGMNGRDVYVCHYNRPDLYKKPLRNVPPTKCKVVDNSATKERICYSASFFQPYKKDLSVLSAKVIKPYDATGYRSYPGNPVYVFDTLDECVAAWNEQVKLVEQRYMDRLATCESDLNQRIKEVGDLLIK